VGRKLSRSYTRPSSGHSLEERHITYVNSMDSLILTT
jgi:hypothetical protein